MSRAERAALLRRFAPCPANAVWAARPGGGPPQAPECNFRNLARKCPPPAGGGALRAGRRGKRGFREEKRILRAGKTGRESGCRASRRSLATARRGSGWCDGGSPSCLAVPRNPALCGCSAGAPASRRVASLPSPYPATTAFFAVAKRLAPTSGRFPASASWRDGRARVRDYGKMGGFCGEIWVREHGETGRKCQQFP